MTLTRRSSDSAPNDSAHFLADFEDNDVTNQDDDPVDGESQIKSLNNLTRPLVISCPGILVWTLWFITCAALSVIRRHTLDLCRTEIRTRHSTVNTNSDLLLGIFGAMEFGQLRSSVCCQTPFSHLWRQTSYFMQWIYPIQWRSICRSRRWQAFKSFQEKRWANISGCWAGWNLENFNRLTWKALCSTGQSFSIR